MDEQKNQPKKEIPSLFQPTGAVVEQQTEQDVPAHTDTTTTATTAAVTCGEATLTNDAPPTNSSALIDPNYALGKKAASVSTGDQKESSSSDASQTATQNDQKASNNNSTKPFHRGLQRTSEELEAKQRASITRIAHKSSEVRGTMEPGVVAVAGNQTSNKGFQRGLHRTTEELEAKEKRMENKSAQSINTNGDSEQSSNDKDYRRGLQRTSVELEAKCNSRKSINSNLVEEAFQLTSSTHNAASPPIKRGLRHSKKPKGGIPESSESQKDPAGAIDLVEQGTQADDYNSTNYSDSGRHPCLPYLDDESTQEDPIAQEEQQQQQQQQQQQPPSNLASAANLPGNAFESTQQQQQSNTANGVARIVPDSDLAVAREIQEDEICLMQAEEVVPEELEEREVEKKQFNRFLLIGGGLGLIIFLGIILAIVFALAASSTTSSEDTTDTPSLSPTVSPASSFLIDLPDYTTNVILADEHGTTAQSRAYQWVINHPKFNDYSMDQLQQKFALATFFFSTIGESWYQAAGAEGGGNRRPHRSLNPKIMNPNKGGSMPLIRMDRPLFGGRHIPGMLKPQLPEPTGNITINTAAWLDYNVNECLWFNRNTGQSPGVETCNEAGHYTYLYLDHNNLQGTICPELALLTHLKGLRLRANKLTGRIPLELFTTTTTTNSDRMMLLFDLERNTLTGTIPSELGLWTNLINLRLQQNKLEGHLPSEVFHLTKLNEIKIGANMLEGSIGPEIGTSFPALVKLEIPNNRFTSTLPTEIGLLKELRVLDIYQNHLGGTIPSQLGLAAKLFIFQLQGNEFGSSLPSELGQLKAMGVFNVSGNHRLMGTIPKEMGNLAVSLGLPIPDYLLPRPPRPPRPPGAFTNNHNNNNNVNASRAKPPAMPTLSAEELAQLIHLQVFDIRGTSISGKMPIYYCNLTTMEELLFDCNTTTLCGCDCPCS